MGERFDQALQRADAVLQAAPLPAELEGRARPRPPVRGRLKPKPMAVVVGVVLLAVSSAVGFRMASSSSGLEPLVAEVVGPRTVRLEWLRAVATLHAGAVVAREGESVRVREGVARFEVEKRRAGEAPVRVVVSGGAIEVVGTVFEVTQGEGRGEVWLLEGAIRFHANDGRVVPVAVGERLAWPLPAMAVAMPPPPAPPPVERLAPVEVPALPPKRVVVPPVVYAPEPVVAPEPKPDSAEVLRAVALWRSRGDFDAAARELRAALGGSWPVQTRELFSFELGAVLSRKGDAREACAHWAVHQGEFPRGRYALEVTQARSRLSCDDTPAH